MKKIIKYINHFIILLFACSCNSTREIIISNPTDFLNQPADRNLLIFPNDTCSYYDVNKSTNQIYNIYEDKYRPELGRECYLEVKYTEEQFEVELNRLENFEIPYHRKKFKKDFSGEFFKYDTFIEKYTFYHIGDNKYCILKYASINCDDRIIYYIYLNSVPIEYISFNQDLLPINYSNKLANGDIYEYTIETLVSNDNWPH